MTVTEDNTPQWGRRIIKEGLRGEIEGKHGFDHGAEDAQRAA
jgi:hypothetical protein